MQEIKIKKVETKSELNTFIKCQWKFYKNDPSLGSASYYGKKNFT